MAKKKRVEKKPREYSRRQLSSFKRQQRRQRLFLFGGIAIIVVVVVIILWGWVAGEYLPLRRTVIEVFDKKFDTAYYIDTLVLLSKNQGSSNPADIADATINQIMRNELLIQEAEKFGIVVTDEEARQLLESSGIPVNEAAVDLAKVQLLPAKLVDGHFSSMVPETDNQVYVRAMLVESDAVAMSLREKIVNGENFTLLAEEYAQNTPSKENKGDFGWHPVSILKNLLVSNIPFDYVISPDVGPGDVSMPLSDNESYKQLGYWLIRVKERPTDDSANVSAIYLGSEEEALAIRARLEAGEELGPIADNSSQYSTSQQQHGELGLVTTLDPITDVFDGYVFDLSVEVGEWSQPLRDDALWTRGGAWLVQVVDKDENRVLSTEDRDTLINTLYSDWFSDIWVEYSPSFINYLADDIELRQWAIERAIGEL